ncbi:MAG: TonB-dependent receptor, partial [bacterium]
TITTKAAEIIVTATRHATQQEKSPGISSVVNRQEIEDLSAQHPSDIMPYVPGLSVEAGTGSGLPFKKNIAINGMPNYYNVVMVDGMRLLSSHIQTGVNIDLIPANSIQRIEIIKDASSALYGSDALGGVINMITRAGTAKPEAIITGGAASNNTFHGEVQSRGMTGSGGIYSVYAGYEQSDGMDILLPAHRIGHMGYTRLSLINRFDVPITPRLDLTGYLHFHTNEAEFSDGYSTVSETTLVAPDSSTSKWVQVKSEYDMQTAQLFLPGVNLTYQFNKNFKANFKAYYERWKAEISSEHDEIASPLLSADYFGLDNNVITGGMEYLWHNYCRSGVPDTNSQKMISGFVQDQFVLKDTLLTILAALRLDYISNAKNGAENCGPVVSPKLSLLYRPMEKLSLRTTAGRGFKAPTIQELYEYRFHRSYYRVGNPELKPEYSTNIAAGADYRPLKPLSLCVNGYANLLSDMIVVVENGTINGIPKYDRMNLESGSIAGVEGHLDIQLLAYQLELGGGLVVQSSEDDSLRIPYLPSKSLFCRIRGNQKLGAVLKFSEFIGFSMALDREYWNYSNNSVNPLADLHNLQAGASLELDNKLKLYAKGSNLLGEEQEMYEDVLLQTSSDKLFEAGVVFRIK